MFFLVGDLEGLGCDGLVGAEGVDEALSDLLGRVGKAKGRPWS